MTYRKVALVSLPRQDLLRPPAALPVLAAICEQANIDYSIWDFNLWLKKHCDPKDWDLIDANWMRIDSNRDSNSSWFQNFKTLLDQYVVQIIDSGVDLIAISVFTNWSAHCAWEMIQAIRKHSQVSIIIGGTGITAKLPWLNHRPMCEVLLTQGLIDYYVNGEGEYNFYNVLVGDTNKIGINNLDQEQIQDLNSLNFPSYAKINPNDYYYIQQPSLSINGSRGCVRACTYCDVARYWPSFRFKDGERLADELYYTWQKTGVKDFEFSDSLINGSIKEFRKLNRRLIELRQQNRNFAITYKGQFICRAPEQFKEQDYKDMADAGCNYLYVGVETFSDAVRYSMDKKFDRRALEFHLEMTAKYGIPNVFLMIVGYPSETAQDHAMNLEGLHRYQKYALAGVIEMITFGFTTGILENTPLYHQQRELEIVPEFDNFKNEANWVSLKNPTLTFRERVRRWAELTETADNLGYRQPRIGSIASRLEQILTLTKDKKSSIQILSKI